MKWGGRRRADGFNWGVIAILVIVTLLSCTADRWGAALDKAVTLGAALWFPWGVLALGLIIGTLMLR